MLMHRLNKWGVSSDLAYLAGLLSIGASIVSWAGARNRADRASAERLGIFVGLWPPTFMVIGNALQQIEREG